MQTLGEKLRNAREKKGATASEAAKATKIKVQHIEALEKEDFDKMAAPIYVKGFIKLYAEYLELNPDELIAQYSSSNAPLTPDQIVGDTGKKGQTAKREPEAPQKQEVAGGASAENRGGRRGLDLLDIFRRIKAKVGGIKIPRGYWKHLLTVLGGILVLILLVSSLKNCVHRSSRKEEQKQAEKLGLIKDVPEPYLDPERLPGQ